MFITLSATSSFLPLPEYKYTKTVSVLNDTGVSLIFRKSFDPSNEFTLPTGTAWPFSVATTSDLEIKRDADAGTTVLVNGVEITFMAP